MRDTRRVGVMTKLTPKQLGTLSALKANGGSLSWMIISRLRARTPSDARRHLTTLIRRGFLYEVGDVFFLTHDGEVALRDSTESRDRAGETDE